MTFNPAIDANIRAERFCALPTPIVPRLNFAGSALAAAMMSPTFLSGLSLPVTITKSNTPTVETGVKLPSHTGRI